MMNDDIDEGFVEGTVGCLNDDDPEVRSDAADILGRVGYYIRGEFTNGIIPAPEVQEFEKTANLCLEALIRKTTDDDEAVRLSVFWTMSSLCYILNKNDLRVPRKAVDVFVKIGLHEDWESTREIVVDIIGTIGSRKDVEHIRKLLETETNDNIRQSAIWSIEKLELKEDVN